MLILAIYASSLSASTASAPSLRSSSTQAQESAQLHFLGRLWVRHYLRDHKSYQNPFVQDYVRNLVDYLWQFSNIRTPGSPYVLVIQEEKLNAFAVPGKIIGVHSGLLAKVETESQFASVIAHEIGHIQRRHFVRSYKARQQTSNTSLLYFLGGVALLLGGATDSGVALVTTSAAYAEADRLRYSRLHEKEADRVGLNILHASRFNTADFVDMFELLKRNESVPDFFTYLQTHPLPKDRIAEAKRTLLARTNAASKQRYHASHNFLFAQSYVVLSAMDVKQKLAYCAALTQAPKSIINRFQHALCMIAAGNMQQSKPLLAELHQTLPRNDAVRIEYARSLYATGERTQAIGLLENALQVRPKQYAVTVALAELLLEEHRVVEAGLYLQALDETDKQTAAYWRLRARIYAAQGQGVWQLRALAQSAQWQGQFKTALLYLARATDVAKQHKAIVAAIKKEQQEIKQLRNNSQRLFGG